MRKDKDAGINRGLNNTRQVALEAKMMVATGVKAAKKRRRKATEELRAGRWPRMNERRWHRRLQ